MMKSISEAIKERNILLDTANPVVRDGFTQVPNFILRDAGLSVGAKVVYAMFLSYAWHNDSCFPGQDRLAADMGMSRPSVSAFVNDLEKAGFVSIRRLRLGKNNIYTIHFQEKAPTDRRGKRLNLRELTSNT